MFARYRDILHLNFAPYTKALPPEELAKVSPASTLARLKLMVRLWLNMWQARKLRPALDDQLGGKVWLYSISKNNCDSLVSAYKAIDNAVWVMDKARPELKSYGPAFHLPYNRQWRHAWKAMALLIHFVVKEGGWGRRLSPLYMRAAGLYEENLRLLALYRPKAIIFSNDHIIAPRALLLAAKTLGIPTIYIQHASISESFPPLKFSLSLLEGQDTLDKYMAIGPIHGHVELIGMPKFDPYTKHRQLPPPPLRRLGIPFNLNDELEKINEVLQHIHSRFPDIHLTVRQHPKDKRSLSFPAHVSVSNPQHENSFEFLARQHAILCGNSSIHLEAVLLNIPALYYRFGEQFIDDYYGYVAQGLALRVEDSTQLDATLGHLYKDREDIYLKARHYNAAVGTGYEGHTTQRALILINELLEEGKTQPAAAP